MLALADAKSSKSKPKSFKKKREYDMEASKYYERILEDEVGKEKQIVPANRVYIN